MKNLELLELVQQPVNNIFSEIAFFSQTPDSIYFVRNQTLHKLDLLHFSVTEVCPKTFEEIVLVKALIIERKICVVTAENLHIIDPDGLIEIQTIDFPEKIAAISWNATEELVVTVSQRGQVATYSINYENGEVFPQGTSSVDATIPDTVYVGWGSKDTQFRGSEGKLKRNQPSVNVKPVEDQKPRISWRGNGEMFVVNYWTEQKRKFIVFETPCRALYRSEECPGLQSAVAWRPAGNMIATLAEVNGKESVVVFEKNGQKRFDFNLEFEGLTVEEMKWSPCAHILTLLSKTPSSNCRNIHLLTSSNYKWYEKQRLIFTPDNPLLDFDWLETTHFTFILRTITSKEMIKYTFRTVVNSNHLATCAVINGETLQITDFGEAVIPPTLFSRKIVNDRSINFVNLNDQFITIVDCENRLKIYAINNLETALSTVDLGEVLDNLPRFPLACHHFSLSQKNVYFVVENNDERCFYRLNLETRELNFIDATDEYPRHLLTVDGNAKIINNVKRIDDVLFVNSQSQPSPILQSVRIINDVLYSCQLTSTCHFYINCHKISDNVNSFAIFDDYLIFTTKLSELFCLRMTQETMESLSSGDLAKIYRRNIEQGANVITAIPNSPKIVLQLPRGNLETISCRLISIDILDRLLSEGKWEEALRFIRLEKLNANLLFDLDPARFLKQIDRFVSGIKTVNELNAICLEFEPVNVLTTLYQNWGKTGTYQDKIPAIIGGILDYFNKIDYLPYITTIMIINLHFHTLRDALIYVQDLLRRSYEQPNLKKIVTEAVNTLKTYGCDQEKLYTESLLLYNLDLAHFVATCCQMDPRIYEQQLTKLKHFGEVRRRYEINLLGKKPKVAIAYLLRCPEVSGEAILAFIRANNASREAYERCPRTSEHYRVVSKAFAEDLSKKGCHTEAGVVLKRAGLLEEAMEEFKADLKWREVVDLMEELGVGEVERKRVVLEMADRLVQGQRVEEGAILYEYYAGNYEMAAKVLIENYFFKEAVHVAKKHGRKDIIVSEIIPGLIEYKKYLEEKIVSLDELYMKHRTRLAEVRRLKTEKFRNVGTLEEIDDRGDLFSDAGSVTSRSSRSSRSRSSTASSRNRRKEEKKKQDLREGGVYEDIALIRALHCTIKEIYRKGNEVCNCCVLLMEESNIPFKEIKCFYELYKKIDSHVQEGLTEIWPTHFYANNQTQDVQELADLENFDHLDIEFRTPPTGRNSNTWNLKLFGD